MSNNNNNNRRNRRRRNRGVAYVASATEARTPAAGVRQTRGGERICHSELVTTVAGSVNFAATKYVINPGDSTTFPWLSAQAQRYEQYRFHSCRFELLTRSPTTVTGSAILAPDYNASNPPPATEAEVTAYKGAVEDVPWRDMSMFLDVQDMHPLGPRKYVRDGNVAGDLKTYDVANLFVCTTGQADTTNISKLWVHYDVELFVPQINTSGTGSSCFALFNVSGDITFSTGVAKVLAFDEVIENSCAATNASGAFTLPKGSYLVMVDVVSCYGSAGASNTELKLRKNAAVLSIPISSDIVVTNTGAGDCFGQHMTGFVEVNGTDTVDVFMEMTGTGTLTAKQDQTRIAFVPV